ncbi:MAG: spore maturation protein [Ruminococcaceae bacterium]|nr:spore maturation protein [Oscillospiraceae bacterium]
MTYVAAFFLPSVFLCGAVIMFFSKKDTLSLFLSGCREGAKLTYDLLPTLILLIVAVKMFSASGGMAALCHAASPICKALGIPPELLPVATIRPISGSGATAAITELFSVHGPDSAAGIAASVLMGSSDTILYTLSVYFAHIKAKRTGYALPVSFAVMIFCLVFSCFIAKMML